MGETRVSRYKEYRQSFIKEGSIVSDTVEEVDSDVSATTSTLPIDEVIDAVQEEQEKISFANNARRNHIIKLTIEISIAVLVVIGMIVLGIFAWGK